MRWTFACSRVGTATFLAATFGWVGCNAIAGIEQGVLATPQDAGGVTDGTVAPDGSHDAGTDASMASDGVSTDAPTGNDSSMPTPQLVCSLAPNTLLKVDDLTPDDGGTPPSFAHALWVGLAGQTDAIYVVTQRSDDDTQFRAYEVDLAQGQSSTSYWSGLGGGTGSVQVLDMTTTIVGGGITNLVLASYTVVGGVLTGLQVVPLPSQFGQTPPTPYQVGTAGHTSVGAGRMTPTANGPTAWLASTSALGGMSYTLMAGGESPDGGFVNVPLASSMTGNFNFSAETPFFDLGGNLFGMLATNATGGDLLYSVPDDFGDAGRSWSLDLPDGGEGIVLAGKVSTADPTKAILYGASIAQSGTGAQLYVANLPASQIGPLALEPPTFTPGSGLALADLPTDNTGLAWSGDDVAIVGTPSSGMGGMELLIVAPDGTQLTQPGKGLIEDDGNIIAIGAVQFSKNPFIESGGGALYIAWIEHAPVEGGTAKYDRLYAAKVVCSVPEGD